MTDTNTADDIRTDGGAQVDDSLAVEDAPDYDNPETAQKAREQAQAKFDDARAEQEEASELKQRLEQARQDQRVDVTIYGEDVGFTRLEGDTIEWLEDLAEDFAGLDEDGLDDDQYETYKSATRRITELLAEHSVDDTLDYEFWAAEPPEVRQSLLMKVRQEMADGVEAAAEFR
ncbi:hypothetical protein SAMN04487947_1220 [Halogeometricum rufum]|uniref:Uncharacterized protein n=1 Tax=Halogeometricum rufum TaxID=553469 RepID=A0A1I6GIQ6_9EURY|nr:hypothetical protein [Halogeometricum rufum]SFR42072.1 hypothetical protein SAMN04487947_1220 [Halogeometricum rufum]